MRLLFSVVSLAVVTAAVPAAAVTTYDAFSSFAGTATGGAFTYGSLNDIVGAAAFTPYNDAAGCAALISGTICTSNGSLPAAFKSTGGPHQSGSVIVPGDALLLHPGPDAGESSAVLFTAPVASSYVINLSAAVSDANPSGVLVEIFAPGVLSIPFVELTAANPSFTAGGYVGYLPAGTQFGIAVNYDGLYYDDSTAVNFTMTAVPEPASWALMVAGFGLVGVAARRRAAAAA